MLSYRLGTRDETIWRYIDTISILRATICIVAQRDISRNDPDIRNKEKSLRCHCIFSIREVNNILLLERFNFPFFVFTIFMLVHVTRLVKTISFFFVKCLFQVDYFLI